MIPTETTALSCYIFIEIITITRYCEVEKLNNKRRWCTVVYAFAEQTWKASRPINR